jgi:hypothetical protein
MFALFHVEEQEFLGVQSGTCAHEGTPMSVLSFKTNNIWLCDNKEVAEHLLTNKDFSNFDGYTWDRAFHRQGIWLRNSFVGELKVVELNPVF